MVPPITTTSTTPSPCVWSSGTANHPPSTPSMPHTPFRALPTKHHQHTPKRVVPTNKCGPTHNTHRLFLWSCVVAGVLWGLTTNTHATANHASAQATRPRHPPRPWPRQLFNVTMCCMRYNAWARAGADDDCTMRRGDTMAMAESEHHGLPTTPQTTTTHWIACSMCPTLHQQSGRWCLCEGKSGMSCGTHGFGCLNGGCC